MELADSTPLRRLTGSCRDDHHVRQGALCAVVVEFRLLYRLDVAIGESGADHVDLGASTLSVLRGIHRHPVVGERFAEAPLGRGEGFNGCWPGGFVPRLVVQCVLVLRGHVQYAFRVKQASETGLVAVIPGGEETGNR